MGFFGLYGSRAALATTLTLATAINFIGIGFQLAEVAVTGPMVRAILAAIRRLRAPPLSA